MNSLALKLMLAPALIGIASLAGRRWGPSVSGWLVGLPLTSGPVAFFLALGHGAAFAAVAATGTLAGTISQAAFCLAYAALAVTVRRPWPIALAGGSLAFALATAALANITVPLGVLFVLVVATLALALSLVRTPFDGKTTPSSAGGLPVWDLPVRMLVATALVLSLTAAATALGPRLTGLLTPFPLYATILAVFAHRQQGPVAAVQVLRGLLAGLFGFTAFFLAIAGLIERMGIGPAFAVAVVLDLSLQGLTLLAMHRADGANHSAPTTRAQKDRKPAR